MEWAGAFGDLGTLIPFVVAYIGVLKMDPFGVLFAFGVAMIVCGMVYRMPFPVQPMKAPGAVAVTQAAQSIAITSAAAYGAGLVTGCAWLLLGVTGGAAGTLLLLTNRTIPAMFLLLLFGAVCGAILDPEAVRALSAVSMEFRLPTFALAEVTLKDLAAGAVFLALPQLPLTMGNAVIAIKEENNRLFPDRPVTKKGIAVSTGVMNLFGAAVGGVPMCHGAGGMAGHVRFGARTGGALVILGCILLCLALLFSGSVEALFRIMPKAVLGVILFLTGAQLALGACDISRDKGERFVTLVTAAFAVWNVGLAFVIGHAGMRLVRRKLLRL